MPQRRSKELWEQFKSSCDAVYDRVRGRPRGREREVRRGREGQRGADRRGRGRSPSRPTAAADRRQAQGAAGAVEGLRPPAAQAGRRAVEAVPRRVRQVLRAPQADARRASRRRGREPREEAGADRARPAGRATARPATAAGARRSAQIKDLQREWKDIGYVPRRDADAVYKAFRARVRRAVREARRRRATPRPTRIAPSSTR